MPPLAYDFFRILRPPLCWASLAGRFCVRWLLHRNAFGDQGGAPLDPQTERCGLRPGDRRGLIAGFGHRLGRDLDQLFRVNELDFAFDAFNAATQTRLAPQIEVAAWAGVLAFVLRVFFA